MTGCSTPAQRKQKHNNCGSKDCETDHVKRMEDLTESRETGFRFNTLGDMSEEENARDEGAAWQIDKETPAPACILGQGAADEWPQHICNICTPHFKAEFAVSFTYSRKSEGP